MSQTAPVGPSSSSLRLLPPQTVARRGSRLFDRMPAVNLDSIFDFLDPVSLVAMERAAKRFQLADRRGKGQLQSDERRWTRWGRELGIYLGCAPHQTMRQRVVIFLKAAHQFQNMRDWVDAEQRGQEMRAEQTVIPEARQQAFEDAARLRAAGDRLRNTMALVRSSSLDKARFMQIGLLSASVPSPIGRTPYVESFACEAQRRGDTELLQALIEWDAVPRGVRLGQTIDAAPSAGRIADIATYLNEQGPLWHHLARGGLGTITVSEALIALGARGDAQTIELLLDRASKTPFFKLDGSRLADAMRYFSAAESRREIEEAIVRYAARPNGQLVWGEPEALFLGDFIMSVLHGYWCECSRKGVALEEVPLSIEPFLVRLLKETPVLINNYRFLMEESCGTLATARDAGYKELTVLLEGLTRAPPPHDNQAYNALCASALPKRDCAPPPSALPLPLPLNKGPFDIYRQGYQEIPNIPDDQQLGDLLNTAFDRMGHSRSAEGLSLDTYQDVRLVAHRIADAYAYARQVNGVALQNCLAQIYAEEQQAIRLSSFSGHHSADWLGDLIGALALRRDSCWPSVQRLLENGCVYFGGEMGEHLPNVRAKAVAEGEHQVVALIDRLIPLRAKIYDEFIKGVQWVRRAIQRPASGFINDAYALVNMPKAAAQIVNGVPSVVRPLQGLPAPPPQPRTCEAIAALIALVAGAALIVGAIVGIKRWGEINRSYRILVAASVVLGAASLGTGLYLSHQQMRG